MKDFRKYVVVLVIAILFTVFTFSTINAFYESPEYNDYCKDKPRPFKTAGNCSHLEATEEQIESCEGNLGQKFDDQGCVTEYYCETCHVDYDKARDIYNRNAFVIASIAGVIAVMLGLYLPKKKNPINEWIGTSFMIGGLFVIFMATMMYFQSLHKFVKPLVMLVEMSLIVWLTYKKFGKK